MEDFPILFVDDDQQILSVVTAYLTRNDYIVDAVSNGPDALEKIKQKEFAAVFTDLIMPEISGMEVLKKIKTLSPETEVIVASGYGTIETAVEATRLGAIDYLPKPFTPDEIRNATEKALHLAA